MGLRVFNPENRIAVISAKVLPGTEPEGCQEHHVLFLLAGLDSGAWSDTEATCQDEVLRDQATVADPLSTAIVTFGLLIVHSGSGEDGEDLREEESQASLTKDSHES